MIQRRMSNRAAVTRVGRYRASLERTRLCRIAWKRLTRRASPRAIRRPGPPWRPAVSDAEPHLTTLVQALGGMVRTTVSPGVTTIDCETGPRGVAIGSAWNRSSWVPCSTYAGSVK